MTTHASLTAASLTVVIALSAGCAGTPAPAGASDAIARVGVDPVPRVRMVENHSSALIAWKQDGVRNRVLVHLDGHSDLDWLPDATVGRIAAADDADLKFLEHHPYAMDADAMTKFGIWNFVYPAVRLGIVRTLVWVVPDGTLADPSSGWRLAQEILADKLERVGLAEAAGLRVEDRAVVGEVLGVPILVCELADLPGIDEPVLLDIDLDYFTTSSAITQHVTERPWISPDEVLGVLRDKGIRSDVVTLSLSTIGGYLPPENRWLGGFLAERLRAPNGTMPDVGAVHRAAAEAIERGRADDAVAAFRSLLETAPGDACAWHCLSHALSAAGREDEAAEARVRAIGLDPMLGHEALFEGDRHWLNGDWAEALDAYRRYLDTLPVGPFTAYALRREAGALMRQRRDDEAIAIYERVLELAPDHPDSLLDLGVLYRERGDLDRALRLFERARADIPERSTYALALGNTQVLAGRLDEGIANLEAAVEAKPTSLRARMNLAAALFDAGRVRESAGHLRVALSLDPSNPGARQLARALAVRGVGLTDP